MKSLAVSIFTISGMILIPAASAQGQSLAAEEQMEETIVIGTSLSRERALADKKEDSRVIEALGADELGQFPDRNVGESLNRLSGVSMLVEKGEGRFVQIRGINPDLNNVTINGVQLGSPEQEGGGRAAPLDVISGGVLGGVQVVKTPSADMDAQGIGGTVNVDTVMPFDRQDDLYGYVTTRLGYETTQAENEAFGGSDPLALDGLVSGKNSEGTFGWLLGASWSDREYVSTGIYQDDWETDSGIGLPVNVKNNYYIIGRERTNLNAAIEFRPTETSTYFLRGFMASWDEFQHRNRFEQGLEVDVVPVTDNSGTSGTEVIAANVRLEEAKKDLFSISAGGEHVMGDKTISYLVQRNDNELSEPNDYWEFRSGEDFGPNSWTVNGDGIVNITPDVGSADRQDPNLIDLRRVRFFDRSMDETTNILQTDFVWDLDSEAFLKTGLKYAATERDLDESRERFNPGTLDLNLNTSDDFTNGAFTNDTGAGNAPNIWMDFEAMNRFFADSTNADYFEADLEDNFEADNSADYSVEETVTAAYLMGGRNIDRWEILGGLRIEMTEIDSSGNLLSDGVASTVTDGGDYVSLMPSLITNYRMNDDLVFRFGITRGLGRPDFDTIAPRSTAGDDGGTVASVQIGNPDLEPRTSWNYDLSAEWYPDSLSILSASIFYKDISDEFVGTTDSLTTQADMDAALAALGLSNSVDTAALTRLDISTTINGNSASLQGIELLGQTQFGNLPSPFDGLGLAVSATFLDGETKLSSGTIPLVGQPESTYAFSVFYQKHGIDASLSYAYNDSFLTDLNSSPELDLDQGAFGRWDAKVSYSVRDNIKVFAEGVNLNDEPTTEFQGGNESWNTEYEYVGRTLYVGASIGF